MRQGTLVSAVSAEAIEQSMESKCEACLSQHLTAFYEVERVPAQTCVLLDDAETAEAYPTGRMLLALCETCGFIQNVRFDLDIVDYSQPTEESQAFSPRFTEFATSLADDLLRTHGLVGKTVLEPGCGKGDFLKLMVDKGIGSALGIDPGYIPNRDSASDPRVEFRREWFDGSKTGLTADLIMTRHLMEHVPNVLEFFGWLSESAARTAGSVMFTEVPDTKRVLLEGAFWDVYHEHCSYFTIGSLARTLRRVGMSLDDLSYGYDGQYLLATSSLWGEDRVFESEEGPGETAALVGLFSERVRVEISAWRSRIAEVQDSGGSVAVWGGGSKAVAFLAALGLEDATVVDINPHKQGKWLPGSRVQVQAPIVLREAPPSLVVPMNPIYVPEIRRDLAEMALNPQVRSL